MWKKDVACIILVVLALFPSPTLGDDGSRVWFRCSHNWEYSYDACLQGVNQRCCAELKQHDKKCAFNYWWNPFKAWAPYKPAWEKAGCADLK